MRRLYAFLLSIFLPMALLAQGITITKLEYFINEDPGIGLATPIDMTSGTDLSLVQLLSTNGLPRGFHNLYVRAKSDEGHWGPYETKVIYVGSDADVEGVVEITALEYFFGTDPGLGSGTSINISSGQSVSITQSINTSGLGTGFHNLYLRGKSAEGHWGPYDTKVIYVGSDAGVQGVVEITALEYFFGTDPGLGGGTAINISSGQSVSITQSINTGGLGTGFHNLYLRGKSAEGHWGPYETKVIYISPETNNVVEIAELEYFIGTDPGFGSGISIATDQAVSVSLTQSLTTENLNPGFHNIYVRGKSTAGAWGAYETKVLYVDANANEPILIDRVEFFVDADPGFGQGQIVNLESAQSIQQTVEVITSSLTIGAHRVYMRARTSTNKWGIYEVANVTVYPEILSENFETGLPVSMSSGEVSLGSGTWDGQFYLREATSIYAGLYALRLQNAASYITTPLFSGVSTVSFQYALPSAGSNTFRIEKSIDGGAFTEVANIPATSTSYVQYSNTFNHPGSTIRLRINNQASTSPGLLIDNFLATSLNPVEIGMLYPGNNGNNVAIDSTFAIVFNQNVIKGVGSIYIIDKSDSSIVETIALSAVTVVNDSAYFTPTQLDYEKQYAVTISAGAFRESTGTLSFSGILNNSTWAFATVDTPELPMLQFTGVDPAVGFNIPNVDAGSKTASILTYNITGTNLDGNIGLQVAPLVTLTNPGFDISINGSVYVTNATIPMAEATNKTVHVRAVVPANNGRTYNGKIIHTSTNLETIEIPVTVTELFQPSTISISAPTNLASFTTGAEINITWSKTNMANEPLVLEYSTNEENWQLINQTNVFSEMSGFVFNTEGLSAGNYFLRIRAASLPTPVASAVRQITLANPPTIALTAPNGGESWPIGSSQSITWTATNSSLADNIEIRLSTNGGETYPTVLSSGALDSYIDGNEFSYQWEVSGSASTTARIKVVNTTKNVFDVSEGNFEIEEETTGGTLISGSATSSSGTGFDFSRQETGDNNDAGDYLVDFVFVSNEGVNFGNEGSSSLNSTGRRFLLLNATSLAEVTSVPERVNAQPWVSVSYDATQYQPISIGQVWAVYTREGHYAIMKITGLPEGEFGSSFTFDFKYQPNGSRSFEVSEVPSPTITLTAPNGGESWPIGSTQSITWTATNSSLADNIEIRLSTNGGETYPTVLSSGELDGYVDGDGFSYEWELSGSATTTARIKVVNTTKNVFDVSEGNFEIEEENTGGAIIAGTATLSSEGYVWQFYDFSQQVAFFEAQIGTYTADIRGSGNEGVNFGKEFSQHVREFGIRLLGNGNIESVTEVPQWAASSPWISTSWESAGTNGGPISVGQLWAVYTAENHYAVLEITGIVSTGMGNDSFTFKYKYQPNGSRSFEEGEVPTPTITLTSPVGGEVWQGGTTQSITWSAENISLSDNIEIRLSTNGGETYPTIIADGEFEDYIDGEGFTYEWTVNNLTTTNAKIKVVNTTKNVFATSEGSFQITPAPTFFSGFGSGIPPTWTSNGAGFEDNPAFGYQGQPGAVLVTGNANGNFIQTPYLKGVSFFSFFYRPFTPGATVRIEIKISTDGVNFTTISIIQSFSGMGDIVADGEGNEYEYFSHTFDPEFDGFIMISSTEEGDDFLIDNFQADGDEDSTGPELYDASVSIVAPNLIGEVYSNEPSTLYFAVYNTIEEEGLIKNGPTNAADLKNDALNGLDNMSIFAAGSASITEINQLFEFGAEGEFIMAETAYHVYLVAQDQAGNFSNIVSFLDVMATYPPSIEFSEGLSSEVYLGNALQIKFTPVSIDPATNLVFELSTNNGANYPYTILTTNLNSLINVDGEYFFNFTPNNNLYVSQSARIRVKYQNEVYDTTSPFAIKSPNLSNLVVAFPVSNKLYFDKETTISFTNDGLSSINLYKVVPGIGQVVIEENIVVTGQPEVLYAYTPDFTGNNIKFRITTNAGQTYETGLFTVANTAVPNVGNVSFGVVSAPYTPALSYTLARYQDAVTITSTNPDFFQVSTNNINFFSELNLTSIGGAQNQTIYVRFAPGTNNGLTHNGVIQHTVMDSNDDPVTLNVNVTGKAASSDPSMVIFNPADGAEVVSNSVLTISWGSTDVQFLAVEFSFNEGSSWNLIESGLKSGITQFSWLVPEVAAATTAQIRLRDAANIAPIELVEFTILPAPTITNLSLNGAKTVLTITGTGFSSNANDNQVVFPGFPDIIVYPSSATATELVVEVPTAAVSGFIQVNVAGKGTAISPDQIELDGIQVSPDRGQVGQTIFINGSGVNFEAADDIDVIFTNGNLGAVTAASVSVVDSEILSVVVPVGVVDEGPVVVDLDGTQYTSANTFKVQSFDFSPKTAGIFEQFTITGVNTNFLNNGTQVFVNGVQASISVINNTQINVTVPQAASTGKVTISTNDGFYESAENMNVELHTITALSATKAGRNTQITVQGTRFTNISNTGVTVNGVTLNSAFPSFQFTVNSPNQITLTVPNTASGTGKITVTQGGVTVESPQDFTVIPNITSISPLQGAPSAQVTIFGTYFSSNNNTVYFSDNKPASIVSQSASSITVIVPDGAIDGPIRVVNNDVNEEGVSGSSFDVVPVHTFTSFSPLKAAVGQTVTLTGTNLNSPNPSQILVNGTGVGFTTVNSTTVTFNVPNIHGAGKIQVTRAGVTLTSTDNFTVLPKIDSWQLETGAVVGATVQIFGSGFNPTHTNNEVRFSNNVVATTTSGNSNSLTFTVPAGAVSGKIYVTNKIINETAESATDFLVVPQSVISSFTPPNGQINKTLVTITGQHFQNPAPTNVRFNGTNASFNVISDTEITATVPSISANGVISIVRAGGTTNSAETFFLAPDITGLSATTRAPGATLTISGTFLNSPTQVLIGSTTATVSSSNFSSITITVPSMAAGTYKVKVIKNGLEDESDDDLEIVPAHTITSFPQVVDKGQNIVIVGTNLASPVPTSITINGVTSTVVSNTGTELTVTVPATMTNAGQGKISIVRAGLTVQSATDIYIRHAITTNFTTPNYVVGQSASISGSNFFSPIVSQVLVNGVNASFSISNDNTISVTIPNAVGTGKVTVVKPAPVGSVESSTDITVVPQATISGIAPLIQTVGQQITITGQNFTNPEVTGVQINNVNVSGANFSVVDDNTITATVPTPSLIQGNVRLTRGGMFVTASDQFTVKHTISSVTPTTIARGGTVSITGNYFTNPTTTVALNDGDDDTPITVGGEALLVSTSSLSFTIPSSATLGTNTIKLQRINETDGLVTTPITIIETHTISSFSTDRVARGGELVITGTNFDNSPQVYVNGSLAANFTVNSATQITLTMPTNVLGATATIMIRRGGLDVSTFDGTDINFEGSSFVYMIPTVTTDISLTNYVLGQSLTLSGANFTGVNQVQIDGKILGTPTVSDNSLTVTLTGNPVALTAGTFDMKLIKTAPNPDLELTLPQQITLVNQASIINITEASAPVGGTITITGTNFTNPNVTSVFLNGTSAVFNVVNSETITATVPSNASAFASLNNIILNRGGLNIVASDAFIVEHGISSFLRSNFATINTNTERVVEGESIYIEGNHFENLAQITSVTINGVVATPSSLTGTNGTRFLVTIPEGAAGVGKVAITRRGVTVESAKALTISPKAVITEVAPAAMIAGGIVTLKGSNFNLPDATAVTVNGAAATFTIVNTSNIKVTVPANAAATGNISLTRSGTISNTVAFAVIPRIFNFTNTGLPGSAVTINGSHFGNTTGTNQVFFTSNSGLNLAATIQSANASAITVLVPEGAITGPIRVVNTTSGQSVTSSSNFNLLLPPSDFNITPASGPVASQFTIAGANLNGVNEVTINGINATTFTVDPAGTNIIVTVPNGATSGNVLVKKSGMSYLAGNFSVSPRIISFPAVAVAGSQININGRTFTSATQVTVNGNPVSIVTNTADLLTVLLGNDNIGIGQIIVTTPSGSGTSASNIEVKGPPMITEFSPAEGTEGDVVTITGTDLSTVTFVRFNGVNASFTLVNNTTITAIVPSNPGTGKISLGLSNYSDESEADFLYIKSNNDPPAILAVVAELVANLESDRFMGNVTADKTGTVYFVATGNASPQPSATQVRNANATGQVLSGSGALTQAFVGSNVSGTGTIVAGTTYNMYFVAQDNNANLSEVYPVLGLVAQAPTPVIALTAPNGGQTWVVGSTQNITWTTQNIPGTDLIEISLSLNNGESYTVLADGLFSTYNGTFAWTVTETPSTQAIIRVRNLTQVAASDQSDAVFSIVQNPTMALTGIVPQTGLTFNNVNAALPVAQSYNVVATNLQSDITVQAFGQGVQQPSFRISLDGVNYGLSVTIPQGANVNQAVFVRPLTLANNGRQYIGSITHSTTNVTAITTPITVNELQQASTIVLTGPVQDQIVNTEGVFNLAWTSTNIVETEPIQITLTKEGGQPTILQNATNATKTFQYTTTNLEDGKYWIKIASTQLPVQAKDSLRFAVDLTPPVVTVSKVESRNGSPALSGTVDDPEAVVTVSIVGFNPTYTATVTGTNWAVPAGTIQPPLSDGTYNVQARAVDKRGNIGNDETTGELLIISVPVATSATQVVPFSFRAHWRRAVEAQRYLLDVATDQQFANRLNGFADREVTDTTLLINDTQLYHKQRYFYRIRAVYGANDISVYSNVISVQLPESTQLAADSLALVSLYDATGGAGWTQKTGWRIAKVKDWQGVTFANGRITALALPNNKLVGDASSTSLASMSALTSLNLANNEITGLPNLGTIQGLTSANLSQNKLDFGDFQAQTNFGVLNVANQKKLLDEIEVILEEGQSYVINRTIGGTGNTYTWTKDGQPIAGTGGTINIDAVQFSNEGTYSAKVTNGQFAGNELETNTLRILVSSFERDSLALVALYNATGGPNWTGVTGWLSTPAVPLAQWTGVTVVNRRVTAVNLSGKGLKGNVPSDFATMTSVVTIDLSNNQLDALPNFTRLANLTNLNVANNSLEFDAIIPNLPILNFNFANQAPITLKVEERVREGVDYNLSINVQGEGLSYQWYFNGVAIPGANATSYAIKGINYETMGNYRCDVANAVVSAKVPGFVLSTGDFEILAIADISGTVRTLSNQLLPQGNAILYKVMPRGFPFEPVANVPIVAGRYKFENIILGDYIVRYFGPEQTYFPTYFASKSTWSKGDTVKLRRDDPVQQYNSFIFFNPPRLQPGPNNRNEIIGILEKDDDNFGSRIRPGERSEARRRVADVGVAFNRARAVNRGEDEVVFELIAYVVTDENGEFEMPNLPDGLYQIVFEFPGIPMDPNSYVEFQLGGSPSSDGERLQLAAEILPTGITVTKIETTAIRDAYFKQLNVFPNPARDHITITYERLMEQGLQWQVINMNGQLMLRGDVPSGFDQQLTLDVTNLVDGMYLLHFTDPNNHNNQHVRTVRFIIKK